MDAFDFATRLIPGERLLWSGRPAAGLLLTPADAMQIPMSMLFLGFALFWEHGVLTASKAPFFFPLFGIPFVLAGCYMLIGRFILDAWLRGRTSYAVTDRRVLIARHGLRPVFRALSLDRLPEATVREMGAGRGSIRFGPVELSASRFASHHAPVLTPSLDPVPQFLAIEDVWAVYELVEKQAHKSL